VSGEWVVLNVLSLTSLVLRRSHPNDEHCGHKISHSSWSLQPFMQIQQRCIFSVMAIFKPNQSYLSKGDFIDLAYKFRQKGLKVISSLLHVSGNDRTSSKWNRDFDSADFWIIPEVRMRWNEDCTGDPLLEYEDYVMARYLKTSHDLTMLSVGCGTGARERKFGKFAQFKRIDGIDIASEQIEKARQEAAQIGLDNLHYVAGDFTTYTNDRAPYDVVLFNSSLHHFHDIDALLKEKVLPILKPDGFLIVFEYTGPNQLQWTDEQLAFANEVLRALPVKYRKRFQSNSIKRKIYRPGIWRVQLIDPSEAADSINLLPALHRNFEIVEEKKVRFDIAHLVLKDIAHHFTEQDEEAKKWLGFIFEKEDEYCMRTGNRDIVFGLYRVKKSQ